jgi:beta-lactamase regulating signal transducer with metallopeptidase domain
MPMNISIYSMISALLFFNGGLLIAAILGINRRFLLLDSAPFLVIMFFLSLVRLVLPIDLPFSRVIRSEDVLPQISMVLEAKVIWHVTIKQTIFIAWLSGAIVVVLWKVWLLINEYLKTKKFRSIPDKRLEQLSEELFNNKADVVRSPDVDLPIVTGFLKAHIFVPELDIEDKFLKYILLHEYQHIKGHDIVIKVFYLMLAGLFWWNPLIFIFQKELDNLLEIRCDAGVAKKLPDEEKPDYLLSILAVIKKASDKKEARRTALRAEMLTSRDDQLASDSSEEGMGHIEQAVSKAISSKLIVPTDGSFIKFRFELVTNSSKRSNQYKMTALTVLAVAIFIASYFVIIQPAYFHPEVDGVQGFSASQEVKSDSYIVENPDGTFDMYFNGYLVEELSAEEIKLPPYSNLEIIQGDSE